MYLEYQHMTQDIDNLILKVKKFEQDNPDSQWQACIELGKMDNLLNSEKIIDVLIEGMSTKNFALTRAHSAESLGNLRNKKTVKPLINALNDPYRLTRAYAAQALGKLGDEEAIPHLIELLNDEFFGVRAEASESIGKICENSNSSVCVAAKEALIGRKEKEHEEKDERKKRVIREANIAAEKIKTKIKEEEEKLQEIIEDVKKKIEEADTKKDYDSKKTFQGILEKLEGSMTGLTTVIGLIEVTKFGIT